MSSTFSDAVPVSPRAIPAFRRRHPAAARRVFQAGATEEIIERFYAISVERRIKNEAVSTILEAARARLFA